MPRCQHLLSMRSGNLIPAKPNQLLHHHWSEPTTLNMWQPARPWAPDFSGVHWLRAAPWPVTQDSETRIPGCLVPFTEKIFDAIRDSDFYVLVLSSASLRSDWVKVELKIAQAKEGDGDGFVIPICVEDKDSMEIPNSLLDRLMIDFSSPFKYNDGRRLILKRLEPTLPTTIENIEYGTTQLQESMWPGFVVSVDEWSLDVNTIPLDIEYDRQEKRILACFKSSEDILLITEYINGDFCKIVEGKFDSNGDHLEGHTTYNTQFLDSNISTGVSRTKLCSDNAGYFYLSVWFDDRESQAHIVSFDRERETSTGLLKFSENLKPLGVTCSAAGLITIVVEHQGEEDFACAHMNNYGEILGFSILESCTGELAEIESSPDGKCLLILEDDQIRVYRDIQPARNLDSVTGQAASYEIGEGYRYLDCCFIGNDKFALCDRVNHTVEVRRVEDGSVLCVLGSYGKANRCFDKPHRVTSDGERWLYVLEAGNRRIQRLDVLSELSAPVAQPRDDRTDSAVGTDSGNEGSIEEPSDPAEWFPEVDLVRVRSAIGRLKGLMQVFGATHKLREVDKLAAAGEISNSSIRLATEVVAQYTDDQAVEIFMSTDLNTFRAKPAFAKVLSARVSEIIGELVPSKRE